MRKKLGQADIAARAGVSVATVSRVLSDTPGISEEVRLRVQRVARELGYMQAPMSASNGHAAFVFLGRVGGYHSYDAVHQAILQGLTEAASLVGLKLTMIAPEATGDFPAEAMADATRGKFLISIDPDDAMVARLHDSGSPVVLVNGMDANLQLDSVSPTNYFGGRVLGRHLVEKGHRNLLYVGARTRWTLQRRYDGFHDGAKQWGDGEITVSAIAAADFDEDKIVELIDGMWKRGEITATAIMGRNDPVAVSVIGALQANGVRIPQDIAVVGFDDIPMAQMTQPALTTAAVDWQFVGREAVSVMMQRFENPGANSRQLQLGVRLKIRETT